MGFLRRSALALPALFVALVSHIASAATFEQKIAMVYDTAPKVRIPGSGFNALDASSLDISFAPTLKKGKHYTCEIQSDTVIVLTLKDGMTWGNLDAGTVPTPLYISRVKDGENVILDESVQVATLVPSPSVTASSKEIYMKTTPRLIVNGTNFNPKDTALFFDPPLNEGTLIQKQILSSTQIAITKIYDYPGKDWTPEPGPLKVKAINTGAGNLNLNPEDGGVTIAEVQADLEGHGVTVESHESIEMYQSTKQLEIIGDGFVDGSTKLRFGNALRGGGRNFTIVETQNDRLMLQLQEGSKWRKNVESLPGPLVLLAADVGAGWVPLGPTVAKAGRKVATVFEDPSVQANDIEIFRTHTHELTLTGTGFTKASRPVIDFDPPLDVSQVYVQVMNRTAMVLGLSSATGEWTSEDRIGPLTVKGMDTGAGMVNFDKPVQVAKVVSDSEVHKSGVQIFPGYGLALYQSSHDSLHILGAGFKGDPKLNFNPPIWPTTDYTLTLVSDTELRLDLVEGSMWNKLPGPLMVTGINVGDGNVTLADGRGVKVATILEDPSIKEADMHIYTTHTKHFPVRGAGFVSVEDAGKPPVIVIDGISSANFKVQDNWHNGLMNLQLLSGAWATVDEGEMKALKIMSIDVGGGVVSFPEGIQIAIVREDSTTALCEDSCSFAEDGQCDEPGVAFGASSSFGPSSGYYSDILSYNPYGLGWGYDDDANSFLGTNDYSGMLRYAGYDTTYQYYGMSDDAFFAGIAPCDVGTDCTDCGVKVVADGTCTNTCQHARDGYCDDPRSSGVCPSGTDCQDCGPWGEGNANFTETSFYTGTSWFNDDDWEMMMTDDALYYGQEMNNQGAYKRDWNDHKIVRQDPAGAGTIFVDVLWAMVVLVGCSMSLGGCMVAYRHFKAGGGGAPMYLPVQAAEEVELSKRNTSGVEPTPDVVRIG